MIEVDGNVRHAFEVMQTGTKLAMADLENWIANPLPEFVIAVQQVSAQFGPGYSVRSRITP